MTGNGPTWVSPREGCDVRRSCATLLVMVCMGSVGLVHAAPMAIGWRIDGKGTGPATVTKKDTFKLSGQECSICDYFPHGGCVRDTNFGGASCGGVQNIIGGFVYRSEIAGGPISVTWSFNNFGDTAMIGGLINFPGSPFICGNINPAGSLSAVLPQPPGDSGFYFIGATEGFFLGGTCDCGVAQQCQSGMDHSGSVIFTYQHFDGKAAYTCPVQEGEALIEPDQVWHVVASANCQAPNHDETFQPTITSFPPNTYVEAKMEGRVLSIRAAALQCPPVCPPPAGCPDDQATCPQNCPPFCPPPPDCPPTCPPPPCPPYCASPPNCPPNCPPGCPPVCPPLSGATTYHLEVSIAGGAQTIPLSGPDSQVTANINARVTQNGLPVAGVEVAFAVAALTNPGHQHACNDSIPCRGLLQVDSCVTNDAGECSGSYFPPSAAANIRINAHLVTTQEVTASAEALAEVAGLIELGTGNEYRLTGVNNTTPHKRNHFATKTTIDNIVGAAQDYHENPPEGLARATLGINDMSLEDGGLFDISGAWETPHNLHRTGHSVDIDHLAQEDGKSSPTVTVNDDALDFRIKNGFHGTRLEKSIGRIHYEF